VRCGLRRVREGESVAGRLESRCRGGRAPAIAIVAGRDAIAETVRVILAAVAVLTRLTTFGMHRRVEVARCMGGRPMADRV
jgi:hypothetical protein